MQKFNQESDFHINYLESNGKRVVHNEFFLFFP